LGNPHVQPPLPIDWEVRPTHPVQSVPYALASLWDARCAEEERKARKSRKQNVPQKLDTLGCVPKALKEQLKRSRGAKGLLQDLEEEVRRFLQSCKLEDNERQEIHEDFNGYLGDSGYVIVSKSPQRSRSSSLEILDAQKEKMLFSSTLDEDASAKFV
jgi:hypothetical protein